MTCDPAKALLNDPRWFQTKLWHKYFALVAEARALHDELDALQQPVDPAIFFSLVMRSVMKGREIDALIGCFAELCRRPCDGPAN